MFIGKGTTKAQTFPLFGYPTLMECLGLTPSSPVFETKDGYIRFSIDMIVSEADGKCLFKN